MTLLTPGHRAWWGGKGHGMPDGLLRAQFTFGGDSEVRYITARPAVGEYVTHGRQLWRVSGAQTDGLGLYIVCERATSADDSETELV